TFIELLPALIAEAAAEERKANRPVQMVEPVLSGSPATGLVPERVSQNAFENIALAHREIYALYEIAQAMGTSLGVADTMALISSKLSNIVPFSCCALFLRAEEAGALRCRFATGIDAELIQDLTIRDGQGLTGW